MAGKKLNLTTSQFAKLHHINKRTLHYYDEIGLFSPKEKGENGYRYYDYMQSVELENILMLKELNMSIGEIQEYLEHPCEERFLEIAEDKLKEIKREIRRLQTIRYVLETKRKQLLECRSIHGGQPEIVECEEELVWMSAFPIRDYDVETILRHLRQVWEIEEYRVGCGSYISLDKIRRGDFAEYDGIYTPVRKRKRAEGLTVLPAGRYLCAYMTGDFENPQPFYDKLLAFAEEKDLQLEGSAYEIGLNEFALSDIKEYIARVKIRIAE